MNDRVPTPICCQLTQLRLHLIRKRSKFNIIHHSNKTLLRNLKVRFCTDDSEYLGQLCISILASAVDPRSKHLRFLSTDVAAEVRNRLQTEMTKVVNLEPEPVAADALDTTQTSTRMRLLASAFGEKEETSIAVPHNISGEIEQFLGLPVAKHDADPLEWWKKNEQQFPRLAAVARQVLSVQPTSAPSERVFSASGTVVLCSPRKE